MLELHALHRQELGVARPVALPDARRQRLLGACFARPGEHLRQQLQDQIDLVLRLLAGVAARVQVVGSFQTSHPSTRESLPNAPTTPVTYVFSRGYSFGSRRALAPGACSQPELCTPGFGSCCLPGCGLGSQHESKSTSGGLILWFAAMPRN